MSRRLLAALAGISLVGGTALSSQDRAAAIRYSAEQLNCARFLETAESNILTQSGGRGREQTSGRRGVWRFRAVPDTGGVALEGWLDSLVLWRRSAEATLKPDTDGLLGGRYRGKLTPQGAYSSRARPFVPDEVAEVAGMASALDDFFPPLPPRALHVGEVWKSSQGVTIHRLSDSALSGVPLYRFGLEVRGEQSRAQVERESLPIELRQVTQERGSFVWHPLIGMIRRERRIVIETDVPPGASVRQAIRSRIEQRISVARDLSVPPDSGGRCGVSTGRAHFQTRSGSPPT